MLSLLLISITTITYSYVIYPLVIARLAKGKTQKILSDDTEMPELTVLMSVFNGYNSLDKRIKNIMDSNYPLDKLFMHIVSDGSTDNTNVVLERLIDTYPNLTYEHYHENHGKAYAVSNALRHINTPFVAFCDIRQVFDKSALRNMILHFSTEKVGAVTGNLIIKEAEEAKSDPGLYWKYEKWIRDNEGKYNSLLGVTGAIYITRRAALPKMVPKNTILDDMYIPMHMIKEGYNIQMANNAFAYDIPSSTVKEEFSRKVRTLAGNFQLMKLHPWMNIPSENPVFLQWISHKLSRLLVPYAMIGILISSSLGKGYLFDIAFAAQWFVYLYATLAYLAMNRNKTIKFGSVVVSFCSLNFAALIAGWSFATKPTKSLWQKH